jgi:hypothetical protein
MTGQLLNNEDLLNNPVPTPAEIEQRFDQAEAEDAVREEAAMREEAMPVELDISNLVIEDDTPVDNFQSEVQQRLLVEPLYSAQALPIPFLAAANVGLYYIYNTPSIVPDVMLSLGVQRGADFSDKRNRSYFLWEFGKLPEVCIELVSNKEGDELKLSTKSRQQGKTICKKEIYSQIRIQYYVVFDPLRQIQKPDEMNGALLRVWAISPQGYQELTPPQGITNLGQPVWLAQAGIGLTLWHGTFEENIPRLWLRWCDRQGQVIPTGAEGQTRERQRADQEQQRADQEQQRADQERQAKERLEAYLRSQGLDPNQLPGA